MDVKYLTSAIIGFIIGLSINLSVAVSELSQDYEPPAHVARWQYLMNFEAQKVDQAWASQREAQLQQAFLNNEYLKLSYVKCYTDVCAVDVEKNKNVSEQLLRKQLTLAVSKVEHPILHSSKRVVVNGQDRQLLLYQFAKAS